MSVLAIVNYRGAEYFDDEDDLRSKGCGIVAMITDSRSTMLPDYHGYTWALTSLCSTVLKEVVECT